MFIKEMEFQISEKAEKKPKFSFFPHLRSFSRKSKQSEKKSDPNVTLTAAKRLYSSFRHGPSKTSSATAVSTFHPEHNENYITLENSELTNVRKDAGILFLSSENKLQWNREEKRKHVQFAPTPLNKYYAAKAEQKVLPERKNSKEDKENIYPCPSRAVAPPILKNSGSKQVLVRGTIDNFYPVASVKYDTSANGKRTPFPRTSTRSALLEQRNMSLPHLNVSTIIEDYDQTFTAAEKCNSLGRKRLQIIPPNYSRNDSQNSISCCKHCGTNSQSLAPRRVSSGCSSLRNMKVVNNSNHAQKSTTDVRTIFSGINNHACSTPSNQNEECVWSYYSDIEQKTDEGIFYNGYEANEIPLQNQNPVIQKLQIVDPGLHDYLPHSGSLRSLKSQNHPQKQNFPLKTSGSFRNQGHYGQYDDATGLPVHQSRYQTKICPDYHNKKASSQVPCENVRQYQLNALRSKEPMADSGISNKITLDKAVPHLDACQLPQSHLSLSKSYQKTEKSLKHITESRKSNSNGKLLASDTIKEPTNFKTVKRHDIPANNLGPNCICNQQKHSYAGHNDQKSLKSCRSCCKDDFQVQPSESVVLTSSPKNTKRKELQKSCKYQRWLQDDCMSTLADDECSLNCSCAGCMLQFCDDTTGVELSGANEGQDKVKYFFPNFESKTLKNIREKHGLGEHNFENDIQPTTQLPKCNEFLHKSPVVSDIVEKHQVQLKYNEKSKYDHMGNAYTSINTRNSKVQEKFESNCRVSTEKPQSNVHFRTDQTIHSKGHESPIYMNMDKRRSNSYTINAAQTFKVPHEDHVTPSVQIALITPSGTQKLNDSYVILLQENFQKLLQNFGDILKPQTLLLGPNADNKNSDELSTIVKATSSKDQNVATPQQVAQTSYVTTNSVYIDQQNKRVTLNKSRQLSVIRSQSLPDLTSNNDQGKTSNFLHSSLQPHCGSLELKWDSLKQAEKRKGIYFPDSSNKSSAVTERASLSSRHSPDGWDKTPSTDNNSAYTTVSTCSNTSKEIDENLKTDSSDNESILLEEVKRIGMGVSPTQRNKKSTLKSPKKYKFKAKEILSGKAKLKLSIYNNSGLVTIHVIKAAKLSSLRTLNLNPYVKVSLQPDDTRRAHWRTSVMHNHNSPEFDQKFSFEILPEDAKKRLIFSVWHRDVVKKRSEFLGCMSFGVHHVMDTTQSLNGWYRLLKEVVGIQKHFAAHHKNTKIAAKALEMN